MTGPDQYSKFIAPATVGLTASATDTDGTITKVEYFHDGTLIGSATAAPYVYNWTNAPAGTYSMTTRDG
ncbi:Ig-like domain-containing protein [Massilia sp. B-10]|nr:Ig-like domain-containing protein [Massilia sp. B-10]